MAAAAAGSAGSEGANLAIRRPAASALVQVDAERDLPPGLLQVKVKTRQVLVANTVINSAFDESLTARFAKDRIRMQGLSLTNPPSLSNFESRRTPL